MFCEIYPQSAAHITTIHECFTILQFTDPPITRPRSSILDPRSRFAIADPALVVRNVIWKWLIK